VSRAVWDASALLLVLNEEPGWEALAADIGDAVVSSVNLSEVVAKLADAGMPEDVLRQSLAALPVEIVVFGEDDAYSAGMLRPATRSRGLSLGDRACLGLALAAGLPAVTADRTWQQLDLGIEIRSHR
jgi:PIN domain nuclease of toxin-antitoxin system